jgi:ubiquinone/menaquinone biosynthesis C-methylase UbiE
MNCPLCAAAASKAFFSITGVPVTCASILATRTEARAIPRGDVHLTACTACGLIFNPGFDPALGAIGAKYESSQSASAHFSAFARSLAGEWIERYQLRGRTVVEVGCGGGDFLRQLSNSGIGAAVGIDPLADAGDPTGSIRFIADAFDERYADLQGDALVCRHTLEHVKDVSGFLRHIHRWTSGQSGRVVLFELPASERIFAERAFWDIYYEHCNYFTAGTLRCAFEQAGFKVLRISHAYDDQYLIAEAVARDDSSPRAAAVSEPLQPALLERFASDVNSSIALCKQRLLELASEGAPLVLWQGASKTVGFLSALGEPELIDSAIDLSPGRHGKFLPGSGLPVHAPHELQRLRPRHIVLMNPVYLKEVQTQVDALGVAATVHPVNALLQ